ncbi:polyketide cyclase [Flavobacterium sp. GA093]|uniref:Polyketide cyclase n=1 Tax=Flavobacterium hydrocarbonoxydans TaxID=2683249 RepID=A0A6I4NME3_9FLAO|nr:SRPBCC domain-containing protein [Flavobacterium hydrocarbonoxydans]MWB95568.1 polyketide cyclase [Flavobacterium hydrocarbonoxydans]
MITVQTIVNAPIDKVWEFWTIPKHIQGWNNPTDEWHTPYVENDVQDEGKFRYTMATKDESISFDYEGFYTKVEKFHVLRYKLVDNRIGSVQFESQNNQVKIIEIFEPNTENPVNEQRQFCQGVIDNFKKYAEAN